MPSFVQEFNWATIIDQLDFGLMWSTLINTFVKSTLSLSILKQIVRETKYYISFQYAKAALKLLIKTYKILFRLITLSLMP